MDERVRSSLRTARPGLGGFAVAAFSAAGSRDQGPEWADPHDRFLVNDHDTPLVFLVMTLRPRDALSATPVAQRWKETEIGARSVMEYGALSASHVGELIDTVRADDEIRAGAADHILVAGPCSSRAGA